MYQRRPQNTTFIDELPEIEDLEGQNPYQPSTINNLKESKYPSLEMLPEGEADKFQKYIRQEHVPSMESGMNDMYIGEIPTSMNVNFNQTFKNEEIIENQNTTKEQPTVYPKHNIVEMPQNSPSCIDVSNHLVMCPVCSRLYNNDKTVYIISIVVLAFICILLLKKVLDV